MLLIVTYSGTGGLLVGAVDLRAVVDVEDMDGTGILVDPVGAAPGSAASP